MVRILGGQQDAAVRRPLPMQAFVVSAVAGQDDAALAPPPGLFDCRRGGTSCSLPPCGGGLGWGVFCPLPPGGRGWGGMASAASPPPALPRQGGRGQEVRRSEKRPGACRSKPRAVS